MEDGLFSSSLLSPEVAGALPAGYTARALRKSDYDKGFLDCLRVLTTVGDISREAFDARYDCMKRREGYYIVIIEDDKGKVAATGALIVEHKFIHNLSAVGHIEDIAVAKEQQSKKLGMRLIQSLDHIAKAAGCYKTILDCSEGNMGFYIKCGYRFAGLEMAHYFNNDSKSKAQ